MAPVRGIEPRQVVLEATVLPLNDTDVSCGAGIGLSRFGHGTVGVSSNRSVVGHVIKSISLVLERQFLSLIFGFPALRSTL